MSSKWACLFVILLLSLLLQGCGRVLARSTPTPRSRFPTSTVPSPVPTGQSSQPIPAATTPATIAQPATSVPPTPTFTPTPRPGEDLSVGFPARVVSVAGVNIRESPSTSAQRAGLYSPGTLLSVNDGPVLADGYRWWLVANKIGLEGWVAEGRDGEEWLSARLGEPRPVSRAVLLGDDIVVSASPSLALRFQAGTSGVVARRARTGERFSVQGGPVQADGLRWWMLIDFKTRE